jgi:uncharacterized membrane protein
MIAAPPAKRPLTRLAGPYGHPFHPILVTIPIGAWVASFVFDWISRLAARPAVFSEGAYWLIAIGLIGAAAAAIFGALDFIRIPRATPAFRTALLHAFINTVVIGVQTFNFVARSDSFRDVEGTPIGLVALSGVALVWLGVSGWLGGKLSYHYGVRVADEHTQSEGFVRTT